MQTTAQQTKLHDFNRTYLALKRKSDKNRSRFIYNPALEEQLTAIRNSIIELQAERRNGRGCNRI